MTATIPQPQISNEKAKPALKWGLIGWVSLLHLGALLAFFPSFFNWSAVGLAVFLHGLTCGVGVEIGWHRMASHRSFECRKWVERFFILCGTLSGMATPLAWVGLHRLHHARSDKDGDPHNAAKGFVWSHVRWMIYKDRESWSKIPELTKDWQDDPFVQFCDRHYVAIQLTFAAILFAIGGLPWVIWGMFVRTVLVWHTIWFVNSGAHKFGYRNFETDDRSTNVWWLLLPTYGGCWHNNHHAFPQSARCGLKWWEIDLSWGLISTLHKVGLVTKVRLPNI